MRAEVVAIGTELLLGQIIDTNSAWIGEQLASAGIDCHRQVKVGDNLDRIVAAISEALDGNDAVICCGGLGPTQDDLTRRAIAAVAGVDLEFDEGRAEIIASMFAARGRDMPENNLTQAWRPAGSVFIDEQPGTAPGIVCRVRWPHAAADDGAVDDRAVDDRAVEKVIYAVPGVPWEMREMVGGTVLRDLAARSANATAIRSRVLRTWGQSESGLAELLADRITALDAVGNPTIAFLASGIEGIKVRVTAKADSDDGALAMLDDEESRLRRLLGELVFGIDDESMEHVVLALLERSGLTFAVAESVTGGLIASRLVAVPGASRSFRGGVVSYASQTKFVVLGVPPGPVVTAECAEAMASGVRRIMGADVGAAVTGVAGPDEAEGRPVGTVCMAVDVGGDVSSFELRLPGRRQQVREFACITLLNFVRTKLDV